MRQQWQQYVKSQFTELCVIHWMYTKITVFARRFERIKWRTIYTYYVHGEIQKEKRHTRHMVACVSIDQRIHTILFGESYAFSLTVQMCKVFFFTFISLLFCCAYYPQIADICDAFLSFPRVSFVSLWFVSISFFIVVSINDGRLHFIVTQFAIFSLYSFGHVINTDRD